MHYLFSHYAFEHPENFLDHWAKPVFVLLSSPFAYFGFKGMILFNVICFSLTALITFYVAKKLQLKYALLIFPLFLGAPLFFKMAFSGLTEYLFGLMMILGIFLFQRNKALPAIILISFLPMVRSEGLIIIGVFGLFLLWRKMYKWLPLLLTGQLLYTIIGALYYQDILWVIHKIPYANVDSPYGNGGIFDFIFRLLYVIEKPLFLLFTIGLGVFVLKSLKRQYTQEENNSIILILSTFTALFLSHTVFWWLGVFNSMGLARVLIVVVPQVIIISLFGIEYGIALIKNENLRKVAIVGIVFMFWRFRLPQEKTVFNTAKRCLVSWIIN